MNLEKNHSIDSLAALLLFAMYVLFLLFLMLFVPGNYQASVKTWTLITTIFIRQPLTSLPSFVSTIFWKNLPYRDSGNRFFFSGNY